MDYLPIIRTDVYFSRARRFVTLEQPGQKNPTAFAHLSEAFDHLRFADAEEALLIAGDHEVLIRFAGTPKIPVSGHAGAALPPGPGGPAPTPQEDRRPWQS